MRRICKAHFVRAQFPFICQNEFSNQILPFDELVVCVCAFGHANELKMHCSAFTGTRFVTTMFSNEIRFFFLLFYLSPL